MLLEVWGFSSEDLGVEGDGTISGARVALIASIRLPGPMSPTVPRATFLSPSSVTLSVVELTASDVEPVLRVWR
jgi:hypothetical protein